MMKRFIAIWILLSAVLNIIWQSIHIKKLEAKRPIVVYKADNQGSRNQRQESYKRRRMATCTLSQYKITEYS